MGFQDCNIKDFPVKIKILTAHKIKRKALVK